MVVWHIYRSLYKLGGHFPERKIPRELQTASSQELYVGRTEEPNELE